LAPFLWIGLFILSIASSVFFSANVYALQFFLPGKFLASITRKNKEEILNRLSASRENLLFVCSLCRLLFNMLAILFMLLSFRTIRGSPLDFADYVLLVAGAFLIFMVFSSSIPYSWAKYAGQNILSRTCNFLFIMLFISRPLLWIYKVIDILIRRLAAVPEITEEQKQEQFLDGVEQRKIEGIVDEQEQEMIENVLEMSRKTAEEIMTPRTEIIAIEAGSDRQTVLSTVTSAGHSRFPVYEQNLDNIIGFLYAKDLLTDSVICNEPFVLRSKLRNANFVPETKPVRQLLREFQEQKLHIALVLDEYGGTAGLITIEDILEVLVGQIYDEYERKAPELVKRIDRYTIEADATTYVDELNKSFNLNLLNSEDYDTVGGFILSHLGTVPQAGLEFEFANLKFTIISAEPRRIKVVRISQIVREKNVE
jgi:putative hemolysin